jgi:hypothetical protein
MGKIGIMELIVVLFFVIAFFLPVVFYLRNLQSTLNEVSFKNRRMNPGEVWLMLIPIFGLVWQFIMVNRIADSLHAEFLDRNISGYEDRPGYSIGIAYCVLFCCSVIPFLGVFASLGGLVCWIIYWVRINDFKRLLIQAKSRII